MRRGLTNPPVNWLIWLSINDEDYLQSPTLCCPARCELELRLRAVSGAWRAKLHYRWVSAAAPVLPTAPPQGSAQLSLVQRIHWTWLAEDLRAMSSGEGLQLVNELTLRLLSAALHSATMSASNAPSASTRIFVASSNSSWTLCKNKKPQLIIEGQQVDDTFKAI